MKGKTVELSGYPRSTIEHLIDEWIFSERDRAVLKRRLLDGVIFDDLGEEFSMSVRQIKKIVYKGMERLCDKFWL